VRTNLYSANSAMCRVRKNRVPAMAWKPGLTSVSLKLVLTSRTVVRLSRVAMKER